MSELFDRIVDPNFLVRRVAIAANKIVDEATLSKAPTMEQLDLFTDYEAMYAKQAEECAERERSLQKTILAIQKRHGKNALLKGMNFEDGATTRERNQQVGGHKA